MPRKTIRLGVNPSAMLLSRKDFVAWSKAAGVEMGYETYLKDMTARYGEDHIKHMNAPKRQRELERQWEAQLEAQEIACTHLEAQKANLRQVGKTGPVGAQSQAHSPHPVPQASAEETQSSRQSGQGFALPGQDPALAKTVPRYVGLDGQPIIYGKKPEVRRRPPTRQSQGNPPQKAEDDPSLAQTKPYNPFLSPTSPRRRGQEYGVLRLSLQPPSVTEAAKSSSPSRPPEKSRRPEEPSRRL